ncbi:YggS family pyridoxal phosphate-dependent enzyme [Lachnospiraceae bacterium BX10]|jgi:pyridoxal phosphate enzyme (YggS family)|uniref:Pyridoxal phosphate homeostasis protein n=1 Tax=Enterocloster hominis (ex Liu et al. 2021) TaxID=2763663 RepID=A0ABR7NU54_9FIRM|nr:YggS family pyridoxal phosphate-dependent enzyme [Enterocloster hominis]MBC8599656.1 YggS family pyridoxal phosphate-dependent enzyme [Enterocloster hominis]
MSVAENLKTIRERVDAACERAGRRPEEVALIAVSKTKPLSMLQEAYEAGARDFGENKVQEILEKYPEMPEDARFHMIGHLQTNKVKQVVGKAVLIHSVDSLHLAEKIEQEAAKRDLTADILLEVNVAREESKFGLMLEEVIPLLEEVKNLPHVRVRGLMTIAPNVENPEENRKHFKKLYQLYVDIKSKNIDNGTMSVLSMGMTGDFEVAVEEGATMIRVGTGIFGSRQIGEKKE